MNLAIRKLLRFPGSRPWAVVSLLAVSIAGCSGGGGDSGSLDDGELDDGIDTTPVSIAEVPKEAEEDVPQFLVASMPDFYFGTRDIGTRSTQSIELLNRSGDIYPLHSLELTGANAEEFQTNFFGEITLNPAEKITVDVTFVPLTDGQKTASLHIDYDIIKQVTLKDNLNEQAFYEADELEQKGEFEASADTYKSYLAGKPVTSNKRKASIKFPVLSESENHGDGPDFQQYLNAVNKREESDYIGAIANLNNLLVEQPDSIYADDALYMRGYIQLMDNGDYRGARDSMSQLRSNYPDTKYYDTALYSEALANDEMGESKQAGELYQDLKDRHTSEAAKFLSLDLPRDNYLSRLWFDRAKQGLDRTGKQANLL